MIKTPYVIVFSRSQQRLGPGGYVKNVDMVFYDKLLKAYSLVGLKGLLHHVDIGSMNAPLNYYKTSVDEPMNSVF